MPHGDNLQEKPATVYVRGAQIPAPGHPGDYILYSGARYFQHDYCSFFLQYVHKCVSVHMHRAESTR